MKAGQWDSDLKKVVINDIPIPEPGENQFLVRMHAASLCHSDVQVELRIPSTITMGHEGVGYIERIHPSAEGKGFAVGDAIGWEYFVGCCFECEGCLVHNLNCERASGQVLVQGFQTDGYFQEYSIIDYRNAIILPKELDMDRSAPLFCAGMTAFHAVDGCELKPGEWLAVVGCGGLGQYATQYAKAMGLQVVGVDVNDEALAAATNLGADATVNSKTNPDFVEDVKKVTGKGAHAVAVLTGSDVAFAAAPRLLRAGGLLMAIGMAKEDLRVSTFELAIGKYRIKGESSSTPQRMHKAVEFTAKHRIQPDVEFRRLEDLPRMVDDMIAGRATRRQVVRF